jgi:hypothetical protein
VREAVNSLLRTEPRVNFFDTKEDVDHVILLRPDRKERVHIYRGADGV